MKTLLVLGLLLASTQSFASPGFSCTGENKQVKLSINVDTAAEEGSPITRLSANVDFKTSMGVKNIPSMNLGKSNVIGYWGFGSGRKLALSKTDGSPSGDFVGAVTIVLTTRSNHDGGSVGTANIKKSINSIDGRSDNDEEISVKVLCENDA